jgi:hypothetical protein
MAEPDDLVGILYGEHGLMYEPSASLGERVWALAETVRRRFEQAGQVVRGQSPFLPQKAKQIADEHERKEASFFATGVMSGELVGHGGVPFSRKH